MGRSLTDHLGRVALRWQALLWLGVIGCAGTPSSPSRLRDAYLDALEHDDPAAAYALLSPSVQSTIDEQAFTERWRQQANEREIQLDEARARPEHLDGVVWRGTTVHDHGVVLAWTRVGDDYVVTGTSLPSTTQQTPEDVIRAFVAALRSTNTAPIRALMTDELAQTFTTDWQARVQAATAALDQPASVTVVDQGDTAVFHYGEWEMLLTRTEHGWKIAKLD